MALSLLFLTAQTQRKILVVAAITITKEAAHRLHTGETLWVVGATLPLAHLECVARKHGAEMLPFGRACGP